MKHFLTITALTLTVVSTNSAFGQGYQGQVCDWYDINDFREDAPPGVIRVVTKFAYFRSGTPTGAPGSGCSSKRESDEWIRVKWNVDDRSYTQAAICEASSPQNGLIWCEPSYSDAPSTEGIKDVDFFVSFPRKRSTYGRYAEYLADLCDPNAINRHREEGGQRRWECTDVYKESEYMQTDANVIVPDENRTTLVTCEHKDKGHSHNFICPNYLNITNPISYVDDEGKTQFTTFSVSSLKVYDPTTQRIDKSITAGCHIAERGPCLVETLQCSYEGEATALANIVIANGNVYAKSIPCKPLRPNHFYTPPPPSCHNGWGSYPDCECPTDYTGIYPNCTRTACDLSMRVTKEHPRTVGMYIR